MVLLLHRNIRKNPFDAISFFYFFWGNTHFVKNGLCQADRLNMWFEQEDGCGNAEERFTAILFAFSGIYFRRKGIIRIFVRYLYPVNGCARVITVIKHEIMKKVVVFAAVVVVAIVAAWVIMSGPKTCNYEYVIVNRTDAQCKDTSACTAMYLSLSLIHI